IRVTRVGLTDGAIAGEVPIGATAPQAAGVVPVGDRLLVIRGVEALIPLQGIVDFAEELARLEKVLAKAEEDVRFLRGRFDNAEFIAKAPAEKVDELREKVAAAEARRDVLLRNRDRLAGASS
ncbi:MAG TPA: hypothetical protein PKA64_26935, partial [Myxococcota bacterium]|nr:hypothetical protein [Myxococcota bacterium]